MKLTTRSIVRFAAIVLAVFLVASSAQAIFYTVTLKNGTTFETRYRPNQADWDENVSMLLTDQGNWIALHNDEIADVVSVFEESGFGYQLDTSTRIIGVTPNDLIQEEVDEDGNIIEEARYDLDADVPAPSGFSINEFLDLPVAGAPTATGGAIPLGFPVGEEN